MNFRFSKKKKSAQYPRREMSGFRIEPEAYFQIPFFHIFYICFTHLLCPKNIFLLPKNKNNETSIFEQIFGPPWLHFGGHVRAKLAPLSAKTGGTKQSPCFVSLRSRLFPIFGPTGLMGAPFLAARADGVPHV